MDRFPLACLFEVVLLRTFLGRVCIVFCDNLRAFANSRILFPNKEFITGVLDPHKEWDLAFMAGLMLPGLAENSLHSKQCIGSKKQDIISLANTFIKTSKELLQGSLACEN